MATDLPLAGTENGVELPYDEYLIVGDHVQTGDIKLVTNTVYRRGDLLVVDDNNVATPATAGTLDTSTHICALSMTAAETTAHVAGGFGLQAYCSGEFNSDVVTVGGVNLTPAQKPVATAALAKRNIQLRKVV